MNTPTLEPHRGSVERANTGADPTWKGLYRTGGVCLLVIGLIYIAGAVFPSALGFLPPSDSEAYLKNVAERPMSSQVNFGLFAVTDFLLVPGTLGLYLSLRHVAKNAMLVATGLLLLFVVLDLAMTELNSLTLVTLIRHHASATDDVQRSAYLAAEHYALATLPLATFYSFVVSSIGLLIVSIVMLKGVFSKPTAYAGIVASVEGIIGGFYVVIPTLAVLLVPCLLAFGVWSLLAGSQLWRLGSPRTGTSIALCEPNI